MEREGPMEASQMETQDPGQASAGSAQDQARVEAEGGSAPERPATRASQRRAYDPFLVRRKSPAVAVILSMMPGLGQVYVGHYRRGFTHILVIGSIIAILASNAGGPAEPLFGLFLAFFWLYNLIDAGRMAAFYNEALSGMAPLDLRKEMVLPPQGGSLATGIVLVIAGFILFLNTMFDVPLDWLRNWWPLAPIGFGVYLVYQGVRDRKSRG